MVGCRKTWSDTSPPITSTVSPDEFHATFKATHEAIQSMAKLSQNISQERVNRIVESASDILGSVESTHIVSVVGKLVQGATVIMERLTHPLDALAADMPTVRTPPRLSLPVGSHSQKTAEK